MRHTRSATLLLVLVVTLTRAVSAQDGRPAPGTFTDRSPAGLYTAACAGCHGADHQGGNASSLADAAWAYGRDDASIARNIRDGITTLGMPAYAGAFTDAEIADLVTWLREQERVARVPAPPPPRVERTNLHAYRVETVAEGLGEPWAIDWLPDGRGLVTDKTGALRILKDGKLEPQPVRGVPQSVAHGQGGLLDVAVDPEYATGQPWVYLAYTHRSPRQRNLFMTRIVRGQIDGGNRWTREQTLFEAKPDHYLPAGVHFGSRIVFDDAGLLYFSIGDRGEQRLAQDLSRPNGKHHRIRRDGSIPDDNPFVDDRNAYKSIYSYGNRNPQGLAIHPDTDGLWSTEHGPMGGDELNLIRPGRNYGWPVITYGLNYNGTPVSDITEKAGMEQPARHWTPSPAFCGLTFYTADQFPNWRGDLLVGALRAEDVRRVRIRDDRVADEEVIFKGRGRVRDVNAGPDGYIYVVLNAPGRVVRLVPEE